MNVKKASATQIIDSVVGRLSDQQTMALVNKDEILKSLLKVQTNDGKDVVSKYYFHDALLTDDSASKTGTEADKDTQTSGSRNNAPRKKQKRSSSSVAPSSSVTANAGNVPAREANPTARNPEEASEQPSVGIGKPSSKINVAGSSTREEVSSQRVSPTSEVMDTNAVEKQNGTWDC